VNASCVENVIYKALGLQTLVSFMAQVYGNKLGGYRVV